MIQKVCVLQNLLKRTFKVDLITMCSRLQKTPFLIMGAGERYSLLFKAGTTDRMPQVIGKT